MNDPNIIGTCSIDTTCTIWDVERAVVKTQLIAHEKEVFDFAFAVGVHTFATAGADGSIRHFDTRNFEHSTIIFESLEQTPFVRLAWNRENPNLLAIVAMNSTKVYILDLRFPMTAMHELCGHGNYVNSIAWAPTSRYQLSKRSAHIATGGDDAQTLIWDLEGPQHSGDRGSRLEPMLAYHSEDEVTAIQWPFSNPQWICISFDSKMQMLKV
eukprot:TRINITY_DN2696_c0_g4_i1.p1 TRINITY_DN2696_c0_g4~~TRINITY_DN2696_c0_g4_i1.p1  ORF type:complete len:212 (-),score=33.05 TRINITY_DN2696_c0_g4_i1:162-797(-)